MSSEVSGRVPVLQDSLEALAGGSPLTQSHHGADNVSVTSKTSSKEADKSEVLSVYQATLPNSRSPDSKLTGMNPEPTLDVRALVRHVQCKQCSLPLRTPRALRCGNSICPSCLPEPHKRENITYPMTAGRREGFICPFPECGQEHSVADCGPDVTVTKLIEKMALTVAEFREAKPDTMIQIDEQLRPRTELELAQSQAAGTSGPIPASRQLPGGFLAAAYTLAEQRELRYDSDIKFVPQQLPIPSYRELDTELFSLLKTSLRQDLDCQLCWNILNEPLTTPCGHTFCRSCVARILDHSRHCPVCRKVLLLPPGVQREAGNKILQQFLETYCAEDLEARRDAIRAEREEARSHVPLFVVTLAYPTMPTFLHVFEPRYRLMIRRALETEEKTFGMVAHNQHDAPQGDDLPSDTIFLRHGTLLRITHVNPMRDGRILMECVGIGRFTVKEYHEQDGYLVAKTERIEDVSFEEEERLEAEEVQRASTDSEETDPLAQLETMPTADLLQISVNFVERMQAASAPWLHQNYILTYGAPPLGDARTFPYWFASVLPISEEEKYALLGTTSVRARLKITAKWVRRIEAQRW